MTYEDALRQLDEWIRRSGGQLIPMPSGKSKAFRRDRLFDSSTLGRTEAALGFRLPDAQRTLLATVGVGELFIDHRGWSAVQIYDPGSVREVFADFFDDPADLFRKFLPVGCDNQRQEVAVYLLERPGPDRLLVTSHEHPPGDWLAIADELHVTTLDEWIQEAVTTEGDMPVH